MKRILHMLTLVAINVPLHASQIAQKVVAEQRKATKLELQMIHEAFIGSQVQLGPFYKKSLSCESLDRYLKQSADINAKDERGKTALIYACSGNYLCTYGVELLLAAGADVNVKDNHGWTALMYAALANNRWTVKLLLDAGADFNIKGNAGHTPLMCAAFSAMRNCIEPLIAAGADPDICNEKDGNKTARDYVPDKTKEEYDKAVTAGIAKRLADQAREEAQKIAELEE